MCDLDAMSSLPARPSTKHTGEPSRPVEVSLHGGEPYRAGATGWVVHAVQAMHGPSFWCGPDYGDGTAAGPLESAVYWPDKRSTYRALMQAFGSVAVASAKGFSPIELPDPTGR
jgi:hypothetical protein